jgi:hypothetical protein
MKTSATAGEYLALAELRYRIQRFLHDADTTARKAGLSPQHYLMMLAGHHAFTVYEHRICV